MSNSKSLKAIKECANWLVCCLEAGWEKKDLAALEKLWWDNHDNHGNLVGFQQQTDMIKK